MKAFIGQMHESQATTSAIRKLAGITANGFIAERFIRASEEDDLPDINAGRIAGYLYLIRTLTGAWDHHRRGTSNAFYGSHLRVPVCRLSTRRQFASKHSRSAEIKRTLWASQGKNQTFISIIAERDVGHSRFSCRMRNSASNLAVHHGHSCAKDVPKADLAAFG